MVRIYREVFGVRMALTIWGAILLPFWGTGQDFGEIKGLKLAEPYGPPHETQMKSLLEAARARRLPGGQYLCKDGVTLQTFTEVGQRELVVQAPECIADPVGHSANSAGALKVQTADGKFTLEGEGFLWQETNATLIVSNRVHTIVHPDLLAASPGKPPTNEPPTQAKGIDIFSDRFVYSKMSGLGVYKGNVHVAGTNFGLVSQELTVKLPMAERTVQTIIADQNVLVDYTNVTVLHATAEHSVYAADTGLIHLTGHPTWKADRREGRGDELVIDQTNRIFKANGNAWLTMPLERKNGFGLLSVSNGVPASGAGSTNQSIEIQSDRYVFRTNTADFGEHVVLKQFAGPNLLGTLSCAQMTATFTGSNELQTLLAQKHVVIEGQDRRLTGGQAFYAATNDWLDLTEKPTWKAGPREGQGDLVRVNTQHEEMIVQGHAYLRMPADELGQSLAVDTTQTPKKVPGKPAEPQFGEIGCESYTLTPELAVFQGGVRARHPQVDWVCDGLTIRSLPGNGRVVFANRDVSFTLIDERGQRLEGRGDNVVYTNSITPLLTNDIMYLTGRPATLTMTNTIITNTNIILDRVTGNLIAPGGEYKIRGTTQEASTNLFNTNMFKLPKHRSTP